MKVGSGDAAAEIQALLHTVLESFDTISAPTSKLKKTIALIKRV